MAGWAGVALALRRAREDAMQSRLPTFLHPLAGRSLAWHVLQAVSSQDPAPAQLFLASREPLDPAVTTGLAVEPLLAEPTGWWTALARRLDTSIDRILIVDAAAAALSRSLASLIQGPPGRQLTDGAGQPLALWLHREALPSQDDPAVQLSRLAALCAAIAPAEPAEAFAVRDRAGLARAGALIRDRLVLRLMERGATVLLPESVLVDVDVVVGSDTIIYPGVVLEGQTTIGAETVVGPGCRIVDSRVGNGVELKGWNYLVGTSIRNRAVLEPYVRRGFD
jgi:hypothetical protein